MARLASIEKGGSILPRLKNDLICSALLQNQGQNRYP